jgi:predicted AAA+ superfamily ATPase
MMLTKEELISGYIIDALGRAEDRLGQKVFERSGERLEQRDDLARIFALIDEFRSGRRQVRWVVLPGLRGVGKTTMLAQTYYRLKAMGVPIEDMLYISLDDLQLRLGASLYDALTAYEGRIGTAFESLKKDLFIFIDEAHFDPSWPQAVKSLNDRTENVFVIVTGSSVLALSGNADTARRALEINVLPLSFREYLKLDRGANMPRDLSRRLGHLLFSSPDYDALKKGLMDIEPSLSAFEVMIKPYALENYLRKGTLPYVLGIEDESSVMSLISSTVDRVLERDLLSQRQLDRNTLIKASNLLSYLAFGDRLSQQSLSTNLGINRVTLSTILEGLERADVVHRVMPFGPESTRMRRTPLYRFTSPAMRAAVLAQLGRLGSDHADYGLLLEDATVLTMRRASLDGTLRRFDFDPKAAGADFIITRGDGSRAVMEVGFGRKGSRQSLSTMKDVGATYGLSVGKGSLRFNDEDGVAMVPREWLLLSC